MEQTKEIIQSNSISIQKQIEGVKILLEKVLAVDERNAAYVKPMAKKEMLQQATYLQSVNNFQCTVLKKLCEIIIDFETLCEDPPLAPTNVEFSRNSSRLSSADTSFVEIEVIKQYVENIKHNNSISFEDKAEAKEREQHAVFKDAKPEKETPVGECSNVENTVKEEKPEVSETVCEEAAPKSAVKCSILEKIKTTTTWKRGEEIEDVMILPESSFKPTGKLTSTMSDSDIFSGSVDRKKPLSPPSLYIKNKKLPSINDRCIISHMESPSEFYIQVVDEECSHIDSISDTIFKIYNDEPFEIRSKPKTKEDIGQYCVCFFEEYNMWYRVEVLNWLLEENTDEIQVQLVDYGQVYNIDYRNIRPLTPEMVEYPRLAQLCHLPYLQPIESDNGNKWSAQSIEGFLDILGGNCNTAYVITYVQDDGKSIGVDLVRDDEDISIAQLLIDSNFARVSLQKKISDEIRDYSMVQQILDAHDMNVPAMSQEEKIYKFLSVTNGFEKTDDINEAIANYSPTDEKRICRFVGANGEHCFKQNCRLEHKVITKDFTNDKVLVYKSALYELELPKGGDDITIRITYPLTVCHFYAQIVHNGSNGFQSLTALMNDPEVMRNYRTLKLLPGLGEMVLARHLDRWHRAQVRDVKAHEQDESVIVQVCMVDFGELVDLPFTELREITEDFLLLPIQAVQCRMFNVRENEETAEEAMEFFEIRYICKNLSATVVRANVGYLEVCVFDDSGEDIRDVLLANNYAKKQSEHIFPNANELVLVD